MITNDYARLQVYSERIEFEDYHIIVDTTTTYEEGRRKIEESSTGAAYDLLMLDVQLYPPNEHQIYSGEDLGILSRRLNPTTKIIFLSSFSDNYRINSILKTVDPDGYMIKSDIDPKTLEDAIKTVVTSPPYYSAKALQAIRKKWRLILYWMKMIKDSFLFGKGTKTKDLENSSIYHPPL